jgi:hypothetical protein
MVSPLSSQDVTQVVGLGRDAALAAGTLEDGLLRDRRKFHPTPPVSVALA